jgi:hypothetical protein
LAGVTEIEVNTAAVTVSVADPLIVPDVAVMVAVPWATLVASPLLLTVATDADEEVQVAVLVRVWVVPLLYVPVAANCCLLPAATEAVAGVTEIEVNTAAVTVNVAEPLIVPDLAVMVVLPFAMLVASPPLLMVAIDFADEVQVAVVVRVWVVPLL